MFKVFENIREWYLGRSPKLIVDPLEKDLAQLIINVYKVEAEINKNPGQALELECELEDLFKDIGEEVFHVSTILAWPKGVKHFTKEDI